MVEIDDLDYNEYDKQVEDKDEVEGTDVKINPDYYIHKAMIKAQEALVKDDIKAGFMQYRQIVEYIEVLCKSAQMIGEDYDKKLDAFKKEEEQTQDKTADEILAKSVRLANKKLGLMLKEIFHYKTATFNLKL
jgi:hypothetical protein